MVFRFLVFGFLLLLTSNCASSYAKKMSSVENALYSGNYDAALPEIRNLVQDSDEKDRLLYLMEAGVVLHTKGDYEGSNKAFAEAENIADTIKTSVSGEALAFALSDNESNFKGESFERVLIKFYMALNYLCLNDLEAAKRYFKKVDYEQKEMKATEGKYRQNVLARYLDAIVSEHLGKFNDARVEYKNIQAIDPDNREIIGDRYILALKEKDNSDMAKFSEGKKFIQAYNKSLEKSNYDESFGELIVINEAGKAAVKESRGKLMDDPQIATPLRSAIEVALRSDSQAGLGVGSVLAMIGGAENPIPVYKERDPQKGAEVEILINAKPISKTKKMNDYSATAMSNFNENYQSIITRNISSIASKVVVGAVASYAAGQAAKKSRDKNDIVSDLIGYGVTFVTGLAAGAAISSSIAPDLRSWRTAPANFQARRLYLEPGEYEVSFQSSTPGTTVPPPQKIKIESGKPVFISFRSL